MKNIITKILIAFFIIAVALGVIGFKIYNNGRQINANNEEILRSYAIISLNKDIGSQAKDMVLATRGFLLTEDSSYLEPYFKATEKYPVTIYKLEEIIKKHRVNLSANVNTLHNLMQWRTNFSQSYVVTRQEKGINSAIALFKMRNNGDKIMDSVRSVITQIENTESAWLQKKLSDREKRYSELSIMIFWLIGIILFTLLLVFWILSRDITGKIRAENALKELNLSLEQQVKERTQELKRSFEDMEVKVRFRNLELEKENIELNKRLAEKS